MVTWSMAPISSMASVTYQVVYESFIVENIRTSMQVPTSGLATNLTDLEEYISYNISVRVSTTIGQGPWSEIISATTYIDGME